MTTEVYFVGDVLHDRDFGLWGRIVEIDCERLRVRWSDGSCDWLVPDRRTRVFLCSGRILDMAPARPLRERRGWAVMWRHRREEAAQAANGAAL
jgi:hypothetical protein